MGFQKPREQTQFQVCSHHMETGEELRQKAMVPALELRGPEWIRRAVLEAGKGGLGPV